MWQKKNKNVTVDWIVDSDWVVDLNVYNDLLVWSLD